MQQHKRRGSAQHYALDAVAGSSRGPIERIARLLGGNC